MAGLGLAISPRRARLSIRSATAVWWRADPAQVAVLRHAPGCGGVRNTNPVVHGARRPPGRRLTRFEEY